MGKDSQVQTKYEALSNNYTDTTANVHATSERKCKLPKLFWFWECMATIASAACIIAVAIILARMQSKPLTHWTLPISLNATIAIFTTVAKSMSLLVVAACIAQSKWVRFKSSARKLQDFDLFDNAARGPLGSLILLSQVRWGLASVGAIATVLALGVDTFAQQVIRFETRNVEAPGGNDASFSLSHGYFGGANWSYPMPYNVAENSVDVAMQGAVFRGIYNIAITPDFRCASNCAWKDWYISLGFASECQNVTEPTLATMALSRNSTIYSDLSWMTMTTPGNVTLEIKLHTLYRTQIKVLAKSTNPLEYNFVEQTVSPELIRVGIVRRRTDTPQDGFHNEQDRPDDYSKELEVFDCAIGMTAYNYTAMSASGNDITIARERIELQPGTVQNPRQSANNITFSQDGLPTFTANPADIKALNDLFESPRFTGNMTSGQIPNEPPSGVVMAFLRSNVSQIFDNLAASMTEQLRTRADAVAEGVTLVNEVFVRIEWFWLILPFGVTLTAALFLVATCIDSRVHGCVPWKSSSVALLYHDVVDQGHGQAVLKSDMRSLNEMETAARKSKAMLE